jgi:hypothetical protein
MKILIINIAILFLVNSFIYSQVEFPNERIGKITYQSSQYFYIRFGSTEELGNGDTLFKKSNDSFKPVLIINPDLSLGKDF